MVVIPNRQHEMSRPISKAPSVDWGLKELSSARSGTQLAMVDTRKKSGVQHEDYITNRSQKMEML